MSMILLAIFIPLMGGTMAISGMGSMSVIMTVVMGIFYIAAIVLSFAFAKRRLNDLNRTGWWMLLFFVPIANLLITIYIIFFPGSNEANLYGPPPVANSLGVKILGSLLPVIFVLGIIAAVAVPQYQEYITRAGQAQAQ